MQCGFFVCLDLLALVAFVAASLLTLALGRLEMTLRVCRLTVAEAASRVRRVVGRVAIAQRGLRRVRGFEIACRHDDGINVRK